jgi:hypothetical protein
MTGVKEIDERKAFRFDLMKIWIGFKNIQRKYIDIVTVQYHVYMGATYTKKFDLLKIRQSGESWTRGKFWNTVEYLNCKKRERSVAKEPVYYGIRKNSF